MTGTVALIKPDKRLCRTRIFNITYEKLYCNPFVVFYYRLLFCPCKFFCNSHKKYFCCTYGNTWHKMRTSGNANKYPQLDTEKSRTKVRDFILPALSHSLKNFDYPTLHRTKKLLAGVPLPTFLLTQRVRSSTISTSIILWLLS